jgi:hypothetical protein
MQPSFLLSSKVNNAHVVTSGAKLVDRKERNNDKNKENVIDKIK